LSRRTLFTLQILFAVLGLIGLALLVWTSAAAVNAQQFTVSVRGLLTLLGPLQAGDLASLLAESGETVTIAVQSEADANSRWTVILSLATTVVSILGFLSTTWLAWRRENRDREREGLELERLRLEIEKLRRELMDLKPTPTP